MSRISAKQRYEAFSEWLTWFNKETGRTKQTVKRENKTQNVDKSHKVNMGGFRKRKK
jgi:hypothetical protein